MCGNGLRGREGKREEKDMKKACFTFVIICILCMTACDFELGELSPLPTMEPTAVPETMATLNPTATTKATVTPTRIPAVTSVLTATPKPVTTATPAPTATSKPATTATPVPTATPKPTATTTPKPMPTATPKPALSEIERLLKLGKVYPNTVIRGEVCTSEAEANEFLRERTLTYSSFAVIVDRVEYLNSAEEYMAMYPEIEKMTIEKIDRYDNGFCAIFKDVKVVYDANLCYAVRTGDMTVLSGSEKEIYAYLNEVLDKTGARQLTTVEAVKVLHDYLVLELKYDESYRETSHSPEGVMRNKTAVCDGYARTMQLLLSLVDIESEVVCGTADNQPHAWNLVNIEGDWYHVDVTWDDPVPDVEGKVRYHCFLKNDVAMAKTHTWETEITCTKNEYQTYVYQNVICDSYEALKDVYRNQIGSKEYLLFCYPKKGVLDRNFILDFLKKELQRGVSYYPEKELEDYMVLEVENPLLIR